MNSNELNFSLEQNGAKIIYSHNFNEKFTKYSLENLLMPDTDVKKMV